MDSTTPWMRAVAELDDYWVRIGQFPDFDRINAIHERMVDLQSEDDDESAWKDILHDALAGLGMQVEFLHDSIARIIKKDA
ncbi:hypothetical protein [Methylobacterium isbiliense]|uniref:Uncharacterized protein n=1 Tax=Methylobacterium isbiliense TaxID=315478 RepID=A0ABQ4S9L8_9HYPH|nr:hypothetical protein [Methylobacterium isbiliense]MDN3622712.1 hypothetical protein [Methylobacterium isbiliense]GJD99891.1 hypothetical protein GMJLKIPL_1809 [Methylobacterium isbiliense]